MGLHFDTPEPPRDSKFVRVASGDVCRRHPARHQDSPGRGSVHFGGHMAATTLQKCLTGGLDICSLLHVAAMLQACWRAIAGGSRRHFPVLPMNTSDDRYVMHCPPDTLKPFTLGKSSLTPSRGLALTVYICSHTLPQHSFHVYKSHIDLSSSVSWRWGLRSAAVSHCHSSASSVVAQTHSYTSRTLCDRNNRIVHI